MKNSNNTISVIEPKRSFGQLNLTKNAKSSLKARFKPFFFAQEIAIVTPETAFENPFSGETCVGRALNLLGNGEPINEADLFKTLGKITPYVRSGYIMLDFSTEEEERYFGYNLNTRTRKWERFYSENGGGFISIKALKASRDKSQLQEMLRRIKSLGVNVFDLIVEEKKKEIKRIRSFESVLISDWRDAAHFDLDKDLEKRAK